MENMEKKEISIKLLSALRDTSHQVKQIHMNSNALKSFVDCRILNMIYKHYSMSGEGISSSHIAEILNVAAPTVSQKIYEFEQDGYIVRKQSEKDRRVVFLYLTPKGEKVVKESFEELNLTFEKTVDIMGTDKAEMLCSLLLEFKDSLSKLEKSPKEGGF